MQHGVIVPYTVGMKSYAIMRIFMNSHNVFVTSYVTNKCPPVDGWVWLCSDSDGVFSFSAGGRVIKRTMSLLWYLLHHSSLPILVAVLNIIHSSCDILVGSH